MLHHLPEVVLGEFISEPPEVSAVVFVREVAETQDVFRVDLTFDKVGEYILKIRDEVKFIPFL